MVVLAIPIIYCSCSNTKSDLFRYKNLLLAKQQELSAGKSIGGSIPAGAEPGGEPVDMAAGEISAAVQMRLKQTNGKLSRAIEDALTRIRQDRFGICEECGQPIRKARLEVVPWTRHCKDCKQQQNSRS
jgi:DnaK suppressor protein